MLRPVFSKLVTYPDFEFRVFYGTLILLDISYFIFLPCYKYIIPSINTILILFQMSTLNEVEQDQKSTNVNHQNNRARIIRNLYREQDKSSDIDQQPPFGDRK